MARRPSETRLGFITLDWKLNASAVIALVLAITSIYYQLSGYWKGAVVTLLPADKLYIIGDNKYFRLATRMVYTNDGAEKYGAIVMREKATLELGHHTIEQWAEERGRLAAEQDANGAWKAKLFDSTDAAPFLVPSAKLISHEVVFSPREHGSMERQRLDFARKQDVLIRLREFAKTHRTLTVIFEARVREVAGYAAGEERTVISKCEISLDEGLISRLEVNDWTARTCHGFSAGME